MNRKEILARGMAFELALRKIKPVGRACLTVTNLTFDDTWEKLADLVPELRNTIREGREKERARLERNEIVIQAHVTGEYESEVVALNDKVLKLVGEYRGVLRPGAGVQMMIDHYGMSGSDRYYYQSINNVILGTEQNVSVDKRVKLSQVLNWGELVARGK